MRKIADHPLVFVNDDDVVVIADGQVMCVGGSAAAVASDMVGTFVDDEGLTPTHVGNSDHTRLTIEPMRFDPHTCGE